MLVIISPKVWPGPDGEGGALSFYDLANPGIISIPLGFIGCWLGTMLSTERGNEREFAELRVRSETGLGAEKGGRRWAERQRSLRKGLKSRCRDADRDLERNLPSPLKQSPSTPTPQHPSPSVVLLLRSEGPRPTRAFVG